MRLTYLKPLTLLFVLLVTGFTAAAQLSKITLNFRNSPVSTVLERIEKQIDKSFFFEEGLINLKERVTISVENAELTTVINTLFNNRITHSIVENHVVLKKTATAEASPQERTAPTTATAISAPNSLARTSTTQSTHYVRGTILAQDGLPISGASVMVKGNTRKYTIADVNGKFELSDIEPFVVLFISCIGYETNEIAVDGRSETTVYLKESTSTLENVVVTGYQTISRERATGSFNVVRSETVERSLSSNLSTALLGTVAGMQGRENSDGTIDYTIRGVTSLYADVSPLIVVDGFPVVNGFSDVNPNDVESITILKDAAAASIWGARSGNGVIVIVTKKPKDLGALKVDINTMVRIGNKWDLSTVLTNASSKDQVAYEKYYFENNLIATAYNNTFGQVRASLSLATEYMYAYKNGQISEAEMNAGLQRLSGTNNHGQIKDILLQNPVLQQYNLAISQATTRQKNYVSIQYENQQGNVIKNTTDRWRIHFNNQTEFFKWMDFNFSTNLHAVRANSSGPTLAEIAALSPYEMILNVDGSYATQLRMNREQLAKIPQGVLPYDDWSYNLLHEVRGRKLTSNDLNTRVIAGLNFKILKGLSITTNFMFEYTKNETDRLYSEDTFYVRDMVNFNLDYNQTTQTVNRQFIPKGHILQPLENQAKNYSWRNQINFDRTFNNKHSITALMGTEVSEYETNRREYAWLYGYDPEANTSIRLPFGGFTNNLVQLKDILGSNLSQLPGGSNGPTVALLNWRNDRYVSIYGNFAYSFDGKYILTGSARSDASNLITDDPALRWEPLWSVGGMWHIHKENFAHDATTSWLNKLTTRLTFGYNGNVDKTTSPYPLLSNIGFSPVTDSFLQYLSQLGNPSLRWERTHTLNFGIDFAVFKNLLFGSIDLYNKKGNNIIGTITLPSVIGTTSQKINDAGIYNRGIEIELGLSTKITNEIQIYTKLTYAYNKNQITKLFYPSVYSSQMLSGGSNGVGYVKGYPVNAMWAYKYLGMENGIPYVKGRNGQSEPFSTLDLHTRAIGLDFLQYMGPIVDPHTLGWTGTISGRGLNLSFLITGKFGGHFRNPTFNYSMLGTGKNIVPLFIEEVLNASNKLPAFPVAGIETYYWDYYTSNLDTMVESSSFLKLKEITLEYHLPKKWIDFAGFSNVKLYGQVRDLGCLWTANSRSYDPEWLPGSLKPSTSFAFGLNINF